MYIELVEKKIKADERTIKKPKEVYELKEVQSIKNMLQECLIFIGMNTNNRILNINLIGLGRSNCINVDYKDIIRNAITNECEKGVIVHNHPSGNLKASREDIKFTNIINKLLSVFKIELVDHIIVSEKGYLSMFSEKLVNKEIVINEKDVNEMLLLEENNTLKKEVKELKIKLKKKDKKFER